MFQRKRKIKILIVRKSDGQVSATFGPYDENMFSVAQRVLRRCVDPRTYDVVSSPA